MWEPKYVTVISGESPDYCVDGLADGFMRWLGKERVQVHLVLGPNGRCSEFNQLQHVYDWNDAMLSWNSEESDLLVISTRNPSFLQMWMETHRFHCPIASVDSRDVPINETDIVSLNGLMTVAFKRELSYTTMLPTTYPCPTGLIPDPLPLLKPYQDRTISTIFMGSISNLTRSTITSALQAVPGSKVLLNKPIPRPDYLALLQDAKIGVTCYGAGFESYRYWEIPQAGCLLVAQTPPILIPHNFQAGLHALFYMSPIEMLMVIKWALDHDQESEAIARAGTQHLHQYHESIHRAQWVAAVVADHLGNPDGTKMTFPF